LALVSSFLFVSSSAADAAVPGPGWRIESFATPSDFSGGSGSYRVTATNAGSEAMGSEETDGSPITLTDTVPAGLEVTGVQFFWAGPEAINTLGTGPGGINIGEGLCEPGATPVACHFPVALKPDETLTMAVDVTVQAGAGESLTNMASVSGGGPVGASTSAQNANDSVATPFGVSAFDSFVTGSDGAPDTQAGAHPYEYTTSIDLDNEYRPVLIGGGETEDTSVQDLKDVAVDLPLGFVGSALAAPTCTLAQLSSAAGCPADTTIGHLSTEPIAGEADTAVNSPLWNMVPEHGVAAEFGFIDALKGTHVLDASVAPTPAGYVLRTTSPDTTEIELTRIVASVYGDPAVRDGSGNTPVAMFTNPSDCSGEPLRSAIHMDSWESPGSYEADGAPDFGGANWASGTSESPPVTGCDELHFEGSIAAQPETTRAATPSGLAVELKIPQVASPEALATPPLRDASVTLPAGLTVNPAAASGLEACSEAQIGWLGKFGPKGEELPNEGLTNFAAGAPTCPEASKIGSVEVITPLLAHPLEGAVYLAAEHENPFGSLLAGYIVIDDPTTGIIVKVPGELKVNEETGQITGVFNENPQTPFSDLKLRFFGGARGELATPESCGTYTTNGILTPWSYPESGPAAEVSDSFQINQDAGGGACSPPGFTPSFASGTGSNSAGGYSSFVTTVSRDDGEQTLGSVNVTTPPGLLGILTNVVQCPEPQAQKGECGPESLIGETSAALGVGPEPYWVTGGKVYLTGPYNNGPFGLSIVVPTTAGPFTLTGNAGYGKEVVRASIRVDPYTSQITVVSDRLPQIIEGIPLRIRTVNVTINRPNFIFNPTDCNPLAVSGTIASTEGATASVSSPFQVANCANLKFKPSISFSTNGKTSKQNGADLITKVTYPSAPQGTYANIGYVKVELPKALPSRLTTLQKACLAKVFEENPAKCPPESKIGYATVHTPVLPVPLEGPAIFVSHGGEAFPSLTMVLRGYGVTIDLVGTTFISKAGITSTTFKTVPDTPFSTFELVLPQGPYSALTANGNLCKQKLVIPNEWVGANGALLRQDSTLNVTGCPPAITVVSHRVKGETATIQVKVPTAGKLVASGKGLSKATKKAKGASTLTVKLTLTNGEATALSEHKGRKLKATIDLTFTSTKGEMLKAATTVIVG
jgi:hypothetical protein